MPVILPTQEARNQEDFSFRPARAQKNGRVAQVVEGLPSKHEALNSKPQCHQKIIGFIMTFSHMHTMYYDLVHPTILPCLSPLGPFLIVLQGSSLFICFIVFMDLDSACVRKYEVFVFLNLAYFT
jgi:hypothetical protein